ncbi:MAG: DUF5714 domain-containing protein [Peptococcaceae bacterium]|nr:DUF5714 domain-containing protein [Peptococcaceae bacterium]
MHKDRHKENCMVCGSDLNHLSQAITGSCIYCGAQEQSYFVCPEGHFVCNHCHADDALLTITKYCLSSTATDPGQMLEELLADPDVAMHGPEHHALVPAVLVTAYRNVTGKVTDEAIIEAIRRASKIPGGYCGTYGACGAGIGAGVAVAVVTGSTPLTPEPRALSNLITAQTLQKIAEQGGARCCKASSRLALQAAQEFFAKHLDCIFPTSAPPSCSYMRRNKQCNLNQCGYFPIPSSHSAKKSLR